MRGLVPLLLLLFLLPGAQALGPGYPDLQIELTPPDRPVDWSPHNQNITFDGTVNVANPSNATIQVVLGGFCPIWSAVCSPAFFALQDSGVQRFNLTIVVPGGTANRSTDAYVSGKTYFLGQQVATNRSPLVSIRVGAPPWNAGGENWAIVYAHDSQGQVLISLLAAIVILAAVAVSGFALARRRRKRREAGP
jgi:hypothetical protein